MNAYFLFRKYIWSFIASTPYTWWVFTYCSILIEKFKVYYLFKKHKRIKISLNEILMKITARSSICHILGNGESVLDSVGKIQDGEFVIAMNSGIFHRVNIDLYMTELHHENDGSLKQSSISLNENIQYANYIYEIIKKKNPGCVLIIKNMMSDNVSPNYYDPDCKLITLPEIVYKYFPLNGRHIPFQKYLVNYILNIEKSIIIQTSSSITTAITLAYKAGFKKIYIHGLDGRGSHYFHSKVLEHDMDSVESDVLQYLRRLIPKVALDIRYEAGQQSQGTLPFFVEVAKRHGVTVSKIEHILESDK